MEHEGVILESEMLDVFKRHEDLKWFIAMGVSEFHSNPFEKIEEVDVSRLIELRAFNDQHEIRVVRGNLGEAFQWRDSLRYRLQVEADKGIFCKQEKHFLDIDVNRYAELAEKTSEENGFVMAGTMSGGTYGLPNSTVNQVWIENYYYPNKVGFYYPFDFRIVGFLEVSV